MKKEFNWAYSSRSYSPWWNKGTALSIQTYEPMGPFSFKPPQYTIKNKKVFKSESKDYTNKDKMEKSL